MPQPTNETWEEKCGDLLEGFANELGNLIVERINDRITSQQFDFTGRLLRQAAMNGFSDLFSEERKHAQREAINPIIDLVYQFSLREGWAEKADEMNTAIINHAQSLGLSIKE